MYKSFSHYFISAVVYLRLFREFLNFKLKWQVVLCLIFFLLSQGKDMDTANMHVIATIP